MLENNVTSKINNIYSRRINTMELTVTNIIVISLFIEAIVQAVKPLWNAESKKLSLPECLSMGVGILVACLGKINLLDGLIVTTVPALLYALYVFSGIALGRGPSFVHDLWSKIKTFGVDNAVEAASNAQTITEIILRALKNGVSSKTEDTAKTDE